MEKGFLRIEDVKNSEFVEKSGCFLEGVRYRGNMVNWFITWSLIV